MAELTWDQIVTKEILLYKDLKITEVNNLESIQSLLFIHGQYQLIVSLIKDKDWESLKAITNENKTGFGEYLDIVKFSDQIKQSFVATIYDNDALWQDPQIIDIFSLM